MKALISVYDKTGIVDFAKSLQEIGIEIVSTGGTHGLLKDAGVPVKQVSEVTGSPEILGGRVKTLHPIIHGGILAKRDDQGHQQELNYNNIDTIDLVIVNLYPFAETITRTGVELDEALENIDIGGPTMIRAAAKNFPYVSVVVDPDDYAWIAETITTNGLSLDQRRSLAYKAFRHVSLYDTIVADYLQPSSDFPSEITLGYKKLYDLRYGENPHQMAAFYSSALGPVGISGATQMHGKELSYNNILDADAAWKAVSDFPNTSVAIIKHTNTCGLASHSNQTEAYRRAFAGDPVSAYGGIVAFNNTVTEETANEMSSIFYEIVLAPSFEPSALAILKKKRDLRILSLNKSTNIANAKEVRQVSGGILIQTPDDLQESPDSWEVVTQRRPSESELQDLQFAWTAVKHIKSNAIVIVKDNALLGMGAGQPNRVNSVHLSLSAAGESAKDGVLASDAFFPFSDGIEVGASGGITAVIQPGGSIRDKEVIEAADRLGLAMVFTGVRHFKH